MKEIIQLNDPQCPDYLDAIAAAEWNAIVPHLERLQLIHAIDTTALAMYCSAFSRWRDAEEKCKKYGEVVLSPKQNYPQVSSFFTVRNQAFDHMKKMLAEFGMTPASRKRLAIDAEDEANDAHWFKGTQWTESA